MRAGEIPLQRGEVDPAIYVFRDSLNGVLRLTYVALERKLVVAFANFVLCDPFEGEPCFNIGYAVPLAYRGQGRAKNLVMSAVAELREGLGRNGVAIFYVEAVVDVENVASQRIAELTISSTSTAIMDAVSGNPALQYIRRIETSS